MIRSDTPPWLFGQIKAGGGGVGGGGDYRRLQPVSPPNCTQCSTPPTPLVHSSYSLQNIRKANIYFVCCCTKRYMYSLLSCKQSFMSREVGDGGSVVVKYKQHSASKYQEFTLGKCLDLNYSCSMIYHLNYTLKYMR